MADVSNLKPLQHIRINVTRYEADAEEDNAQANAKGVSTSVANKLNEYIAKLGYTNAQMYNIASRLLSRGKVRLQFRSYIERLELADTSDKMSQPEAIAMIDKFLAAVQDQEDDTSTTQRIVVHH